MVGTTISHFKVLEKIGEGGMGVVYRATDTKLNRDVALKILPQQFASDSQRMGRFQREAEVLASLDHPNIGQIYGIEDAGKTKALVLQLIEGPTLAERIAQGPIPVEDALKIALQIAEGVEAAHEKGVIHRDLKPANIKITPEGQVKILDFGLAKAFEGESPITDMSQSPTLTEGMTRAGVILGTAAYMSPEQATGKPVDKKADIFAFGCVLYEMLTGKRAFEGETITETLAAVLRAEPDWEALPENTAWRITDLLRQCLQKDLQRRLHHIGDVRIQIELSFTDPSLLGSGTTGVPARHRQIHWPVAVVLSILAFLAGIAVLRLMSPGSSPDFTRGRFVISLGLDQDIVETTGYDLAISPDGESVVYGISGSGQDQLHLRPIDSFETQPIPGTENASQPFFSPDGQWIGFTAGSRVLKVSIKGGTPFPILQARTSTRSSPDWGEADLIVFGGSGGLSLVPASGGELRQLTTVTEDDEISHNSPHFLPGGEALLFSNLKSNGPEIWLLFLETGERRKLIEGSSPQYASSGHVVYQRGGSLHAVPFDLNTLEVMGASSPLPPKVYVSRVPEWSQYRMSDNGLLIYRPAVPVDVKSSLVLVDREGRAQPLTEIQGSFQVPRFSPDGERIAVTFWKGPIGTLYRDVWIYEISRDILTPFTLDGSSYYPVWTRDGRKLTFSSTRAGPWNVFWMPLDKSGVAEQLTDREPFNIAHSWSPEGVLAFTEGSRAAVDIWTLSNGQEPTEFIASSFHERNPMFSPDGHWIAFTSNQSGRDEVYVKPYPSQGAVVQISAQGGHEPMWGPNGKELFYRSGNAMMAVSVEMEPTFRPGRPRLLFEGNYDTEFVGLTSNYDVSPDGQKFLMASTEVDAPPDQINIVLNWFEELKRLAPTN